MFASSLPSGEVFCYTIPVAIRLLRCGLPVALTLAAAAAGAARAGPPFATDDPEPTDYGHFEAYLYSQASWGGDATGTAVGLEVNYGALPDLQVSVALPVGFNASDDAGPRFGIGDAELGLKYRFIHEDCDGWMPQVGFFPSVDAALVRSSATSSDRPIHVFLPLWAQKSFGDWTTFGGGGYRINDGNNAKDSWFIGWAALKQISDGLRLGGEIYREAAETRGTNDTTAVGVGATYDLSDAWHVIGSTGIGIEDRTGNTALSSYLALELTM